MAVISKIPFLGSLVLKYAIGNKKGEIFAVKPKSAAGQTPLLGRC